MGGAGKYGEGGVRKYGTRKEVREKMGVGGGGGGR